MVTPRRTMGTHSLAWPMAREKSAPFANTAQSAARGKSKVEKLKPGTPGTIRTLCEHREGCDRKVEGEPTARLPSAALPPFRLRRGEAALRNGPRKIRTLREHREGCDTRNGKGRRPETGNTGNKPHPSRKPLRVRHPGKSKAENLEPGTPGTIRTLRENR